jgi:hypothetical protein
MLRQGALASFIVIAVACSPEVDDPANFTAGNTNGNSAGTTAGATDGGSAEATTQVADGSASATSSSGGGVDTSDGGPGPASTGPVADEGPVGDCGNGVIDAGEQCDGADLQGFDCASLGLNGGTLACDPMMCTFDTSMCSSDTGTSG